MPGWARLLLTPDGDGLNITAAYGTTGAVSVTLDQAGTRRLAELAATVGRVLDLDSPTPEDYQEACGTIDASGGFVSVHARMLRTDGPPRPAADVFVSASNGNYAVRFRADVWAEITETITSAGRPDRG